VFRNETAAKKIDIMKLAERGGLDWKKVPDEDFPAEIIGGENAASELSRLRAELSMPVPQLHGKVGKNAPKNLTTDQALRLRRIKDFFGCRVLMKVDRARNDSSLPPEMNPVEVRLNGLRNEFPSGRWVGGCVSQIDGLQDAHGHLLAQCKNRTPPTDLPRGSDLAFEGMEVVYFELKKFTVTIHIPRSAYPASQKAA
jgi:hypothetical protein